MTDVVKTAEQGDALGNGVRQLVGADGRQVHENWLELIEYCQKRPHVSMRLNVADGVPVSAEEVVPHIRFGSTRRRQIRSVGR